LKGPWEKPNFKQINPPCLGKFGNLFGKPGKPLLLNQFNRNPALKALEETNLQELPPCLG